MSKNNLFFLFLYCIILFQIFTTSNGKAVTDGNDCSQYKEMIDIYKLKIDDLEKKNKKLELEVEELREWKRKEQEKKGEEEEEEEPDQTEIDLFKNIDSKIINTQEEFSLLYKRLKKNSELIDFKLLYRKTEDGNSAADFHKKCDDIPYTVSIIKSNTGYKFGGYIDGKWSNKYFTWVYHDIKSFVFSLDLMKVYDSTETTNEKYFLGESTGPQFWAFTVGDEYGYTKSDFKPYGNVLQSLYYDGNKYFTGFPSNYEINGGAHYFYISELEVFQVVYKDQ